MPMKRRSPSEITCILCGAKVPAGKVLEHKHEVHGEALHTPKTVYLSPSEPTPPRVTRDDEDDVVGWPGVAWEARRASVLDGTLTPSDPFLRPSSTAISQAALLDRAEWRCANPTQTVTGFSDWVYSLYRSGPRPESLKEGEEAELRISRRKRWARVLGPSEAGGWTLLHNGMNTGKSERPASFAIPSLTVRNRPIFGCPDLVYARGNQRIIVEIKWSMRVIPWNLWPNVWAQLWAYSRIPEFASANISVVGEVWGENHWHRLSWRGFSSDVYLRHSARRDPLAEKFDRYFSYLFSKYGGMVSPTAP